MKKLYEKNEVGFALVWIGLYVVIMNIALQVCDGFDNLHTKTPGQLLVPVVCICAMAVAATAWILKNGLGEKFGLHGLRGSAKGYLWFIPLILMSCINLRNGLGLNAPATLSVLMAVNLAVGGYVEEVIFRGFLFRAMEKDNLKSAIIVSAVTFGAGHIVNLANTADTLSVLLQVCYAIAIGFLYTIIVYKGGSLWPCVVSHIFVNGSSVFAREQGPFNSLVHRIFGQSSLPAEEICSAGLIILISGSYALWLWRRKNEVSV